MNNSFQEGKLLRWNDDKGFGFIASGDGGKDVFIHISALKRMVRRPAVGDLIFYQVHTDNDGKRRAVKQTGKSPGFAGGLEKFDSSGSPSRKLRVVSRQAHNRGESRWTKLKA